MNKNEYTTKGARVIFNGRPGVVMKALEYKTVINFDDAERWVHLRHNQNDMSLLKSFKASSEKSSYSEAVRKSVKVLNTPMGSVQQKQDYINYKLVSEGWSTNEAMTIFMEALNIASNGELLKNI